MKKMNYRSCPECGARADAGAERCDLCGAPLEALGGADAPDEGVAAGAQTAASIGDAWNASGAGEVANDALYCNACGAENPPGSNFCSRCGVRLRSAASGAAADAAPGAAPAAAGASGASGAVPVRAAELPRPAGGGAHPDDSQRSVTVPPPQPSTPAEAAAGSESRGLTRHVVAVVGLSVLLVVALYMITVISKQPGTRDSEAIASAPVEARAASVIQEHEAIPVSETYRSRVDSLRSVIESVERTESIGARRQLVDFLIGIGRVDRAAIEQQRVARITDEAADWKMAGNLLFDWMEMSESDAKSDVALLTIDAYKELLERQPDDLDARADLGWAYQYDPRNPMEAIRQTNLVLEESPDHLGANYNRGVFLLRINRLDDAIEQFERVKSIAGADSPYYRQAEMWIDTIEESRGAGES